MAQQAAFWINREAVFNFGGKDYKYGDKLPAGVDDAAITAFIKKGKVSRTAPSAPAAAPGEVELLKERLAATVKERDEARESAGGAAAVIDQITAQRDKAEETAREGSATIEQLTAQLAAAQQTIAQLTAAALPAGGAGPKEAK